MAFDSNSGVLTYTGPSSSDTRAHFSGGTGVSLIDGTISIGQAVGTNDDVTFNDISSTAGSIYGFDASLTNISATTYTLSSNDNGKVITLDNTSGITLTIPTGLGDGFNCLIIQKGTGQVFVSPSSTTIINRQGHTKSAGQYAVVSLVNIGNDTFIVAGDTGI